MNDFRYLIVVYDFTDQHRNIDVWCKDFNEVIQMLVKYRDYRLDVFEITCIYKSKEKY